MPYKDPEVRRTKNKEYGQEWYKKNKAAVMEKSRQAKIRSRVLWNEFKSTLACVKCGENHPATLDFHHVIRGKDNHRVHQLISNGAYKKALEEIKKCIVLCANCHRKHHYDEKREKNRKRKGGRSPRD